MVSLCSFTCREMARAPVDAASQKQQLLNPLAVLEAVEQAMSDKAIIVGDGGDFVASAAYILRFVSYLGGLGA